MTSAIQKRPTNFSFSESEKSARPATVDTQPTYAQAASLAHSTPQTLQSTIFGICPTSAQTPQIDLTQLRQQVTPLWAQVSHRPTFENVFVPRQVTDVELTQQAVTDENTLARTLVPLAQTWQMTLPTDQAQKLLEQTDAQSLSANASLSTVVQETVFAPTIYEALHSPIAYVFEQNAKRIKAMGFSETDNPTINHLIDRLVAIKDFIKTGSGTKPEALADLTIPDDVAEKRTFFSSFLVTLGMSDDFVSWLTTEIWDGDAHRITQLKTWLNTPLSSSAPLGEHLINSIKETLVQTIQFAAKYKKSWQELIQRNSAGQITNTQELADTLPTLIRLLPEKWLLEGFPIGSCKIPPLLATAKKLFPNSFASQAPIAQTTAFDLAMAKAVEKKPAPALGLTRILIRSVIVGGLFAALNYFTGGVGGTVISIGGLVGAARNAYAAEDLLRVARAAHAAGFNADPEAAQRNLYMAQVGLGTAALGGFATRGMLGDGTNAPSIIRAAAAGAIGKLVTQGPLTALQIFEQTPPPLAEGSYTSHIVSTTVFEVVPALGLLALEGATEGAAGAITSRLLAERTPVPTDPGRPSGLPPRPPAPPAQLSTIPKPILIERIKFDVPKDQFVPGQRYPAEVVLAGAPDPIRVLVVPEGVGKYVPDPRSPGNNTPILFLRVLSPDRNRPFPFEDRLFGVHAPNIFHVPNNTTPALPTTPPPPPVFRGPAPLLLPAADPAVPTAPTPNAPAPNAQPAAQAKPSLYAMTPNPQSGILPGEQPTGAIYLPGGAGRFSRSKRSDGDRGAVSRPFFARTGRPGPSPSASTVDLSREITATLLRDGHSQAQQAAVRATIIPSRRSDPYYRMNPRTFTVELPQGRLSFTATGELGQAQRWSFPPRDVSLTTPNGRTIPLTNNQFGRDIPNQRLWFKLPSQNPNDPPEEAWVPFGVVAQVGQFKKENGVEPPVIETPSIMLIENDPVKMRARAKKAIAQALQEVDPSGVAQNSTADRRLVVMNYPERPVPIPVEYVDSNYYNTEIPTQLLQRLEDRNISIRTIGPVVTRPHENPPTLLINSGNSVVFIKKLRQAVITFEEGVQATFELFSIDDPVYHLTYYASFVKVGPMPNSPKYALAPTHFYTRDWFTGRFSPPFILTPIAEHFVMHGEGRTQRHGFAERVTLGLHLDLINGFDGYIAVSEAIRSQRQAETAAAQPTPVAAQPAPAATQPAPAAAQPEPVTAQPAPAATHLGGGFAASASDRTAAQLGTGRRGTATVSADRAVLSSSDPVQAEVISKSGVSRHLLALDERSLNNSGGAVEVETFSLQPQIDTMQIKVGPLLLSAERSQRSGLFSPRARMGYVDPTDANKRLLLAANVIRLANGDYLFTGTERLAGLVIYLPRGQAPRLITHPDYEALLAQALGFSSATQGLSVNGGIPVPSDEILREQLSRNGLTVPATGILPTGYRTLLRRVFNGSSSSRGLGERVVDYVRTDSSYRSLHDLFELVTPEITVGFQARESLLQAIAQAYFTSSGSSPLDQVAGLSTNLKNLFQGFITSAQQSQAPTTASTPTSGFDVSSFMNNPPDRWTATLQSRTDRATHYLDATLTFQNSMGVRSIAYGTGTYIPRTQVLTLDLTVPSLSTMPSTPHAGQDWPAPEVLARMILSKLPSVPKKIILKHSARSDLQKLTLVQLRRLVPAETVIEETQANH